MHKKIFFDANIILDIFDDTRSHHKTSVASYLYILENDIELFTSCDIVTTVFYVYGKKNASTALEKIQNLNKTLTIIAFSNNEVEQTCMLMQEDSNYKDLEDTIQYILAQKSQCDLIISNDTGFVSKDIPVVSSKKFYQNVLF